MTSRTIPRPFNPIRALRRSSTLGMVYALAVIVFYTVIFLIPFGMGIWLAFQNWDFITNPVFIGFRNFSRLFADKYFWEAVRTTLMFAVAEITIGVAGALLLALLISNVRQRLQRVFLALYYLPVITPGVVTIYLWSWLYRPTGGVFNTVLQGLSLPAQPFMNSAQQALWCITVMIVWANVGGAAVIMLAGIRDIPESLFEAARIDGAGFWQIFFRVTLPLLRPVLVYQVVVSVIGTVQLFEPFYLMSGPGFSTRTLALYTYQLGFQSVNLGYGSAVSLVMFLFLLVATIIQLRRWEIRWEH